MVYSRSGRRTQCAVKKQQQKKKPSMQNCTKNVCGSAEVRAVVQSSALQHKGQAPAKGRQLNLWVRHTYDFSVQIF